MVRVRLVVSSHKTGLTRSSVPAGSLEEWRLVKYGREAKLLQDRKQERSLSTGDYNEHSWLLRAHERSVQGLLDADQAKKLKKYARWDQAEQIQTADTGDLPLTKIFQSDAAGVESPHDARDIVSSVDPLATFPKGHTKERRSESQPAPLQSPDSLTHHQSLNPKRGAEVSLLRRFGQWRRLFGERYRGPKRTQPLPNFFTRRDTLFFHLAKGTLRIHQPPPAHYHDFFDAATRVVRVEDIIGYKFKNKMICLEALKTSNEEQPLYWQGIITPVEKNNRLALVGDRALALTLCELWWHTKLDNRRYALLSNLLESRKALEQRALRLGLDYPILVSYSKTIAVSQDIAETFEAIVGAVYVDSGKDLEAVRTAVKNLGLEHDLRQIADQTERAESDTSDYDTNQTTSENLAGDRQKNELAEVPLPCTTSADQKTSVGSRLRNVFSQQVARWRAFFGLESSQPVEESKFYEDLLSEPVLESHAEAQPLEELLSRYDESQTSTLGRFNNGSSKNSTRHVIISEPTSEQTSAESCSEPPDERDLLMQKRHKLEAQLAGTTSTSTYEKLKISLTANSRTMRQAKVTFAEYEAFKSRSLILYYFNAPQYRTIEQEVLRLEFHLKSRTLGKVDRAKSLENMQQMKRRMSLLLVDEDTQRGKAAARRIVEAGRLSKQELLKLKATAEQQSSTVEDVLADRLRRYAVWKQDKNHVIDELTRIPFNRTTRARHRRLLLNYNKWIDAFQKIFPSLQTFKSEQSGLEEGRQPLDKATENPTEGEQVGKVEMEQMSKEEERAKVLQAQNDSASETASVVKDPDNGVVQIEASVAAEPGRSPTEAARESRSAIAALTSEMAALTSEMAALDPTSRSLSEFRPDLHLSLAEWQDFIEWRRIAGAELPEGSKL